MLCMFWYMCSLAHVAEEGGYVSELHISGWKENFIERKALVGIKLMSEE